MFKIMNDKAPTYLKNMVPKCHQSDRLLRNRIPTFHCRTDCFRNYFFHCTLNDWFELDETITSESISIFKSRLLSMICPIPNNVYNIFDPTGLKLLTRMHLGFSHRFQHNFKNL